MLRARAIQHRKGETSLPDRELAKMTRNGRLGSAFAGLANWATGEGNDLTRPMMEAVVGIDRKAHLPPFMETPLANKAAGLVPSSSEGLRNLFAMLGGAGTTLLCATPLFVPHPRIAALARDLGCTRVFECEAGDSGLIAALQAHFRE